MLLINWVGFVLVGSRVSVDSVGVLVRMEFLLEVAYIIVKKIICLGQIRTPLS